MINKNKYNEKNVKIALKKFSYQWTPEERDILTWWNAEQYMLNRINNKGVKEVKVINV